MRAYGLGFVALLVAPLLAGAAPPPLEVNFPLSSVTVGGEGTLAVSWKSRAAPGSIVLVQASTDSGKTWKDLAARPAEDGLYLIGSQDFPEGVPVQVRLEPRDPRGTAGVPVLAPGAFTLDRSPPQAKVRGPERSEKPQMEVQVEASDGKGSGVATVLLWVTQPGEPWTLAAEWSDPSRPLPWTAPHRGRWGLTATASDKAGNKATPPGGEEAPQLWMVVDTPEPWISKFQVEGSDYVVAPGHPLPLIWAVEGEGMDEKPVTLEVRDPGGAWTPVLQGLPAKGRTSWRVPLCSGPVPTLRLKARSGRHEATPRELSPWVLVDADPPGVALEGPALWTRLEPVVLEVRAVDTVAGLSGLKLWCLDPASGAWVEGKRVSAFKPLTFQERDGRYGLWVSAEDGLGNASKPPAQGDKPMLELVIDREPPAVSILFPRPGAEAEAGSSIPVSWFAEDENLPPDPVGLFVSRDAGATWELLKDSLPAQGEIECRLPDPEGPLWIRVSALDAAGHLGEAVLERPLALKRKAAAPPPAPPLPPPPTLAEAPILLGFPPREGALAGGRELALRWTPPAIDGLSVRIEASAPGGWEEIGSAPALAGELVWKVPAVDRAGMRLRLSVLRGQKVLARSESPPFTVASKPPRLSLVLPEAPPREP